MISRTAWTLIGWDDGDLRIVGGRATYEAVSYEDSRGGLNVKLERIDTGATVADGLRVVTRYVDPDTRLEPADAMAESAMADWPEDPR